LFLSRKATTSISDLTQSVVAVVTWQKGTVKIMAYGKAMNCR